MSDIFNEIKSNINLISYLIADGFIENKKKSTKKYKILDKNNIKFLVYQIPNLNYLLYKDMNNNKNGSVLDYMKEYQNKEWKDILQNNTKTQIEKNKKIYKKINIIETKKDKSIELKLAYIYNKLPNYKPNISTIDNYLQKRNIDPKILLDNRFENTIKYNSKYDNILIPHYDSKKIVGGEIITEDRKQFIKNGIKTNYITNHNIQDKNIIITESFIDLVSYYSLHPKKLENTLGIETAGEISRLTEDNIKKILLKKNNINKIIIATDNDKKGDIFAEKIKTLTIDINSNKTTNEIVKTERFALGKYKDLNEKLQAEKKELKTKKLKIKL